MVFEIISNIVHKIYPYRANGELKTYVVIAELWRPKGPPSRAPYPYRKEKETHE